MCLAVGLIAQSDQVQPLVDPALLLRGEPGPQCGEDALGGFHPQLEILEDRGIAEDRGLLEPPPDACAGNVGLRPPGEGVGFPQNPSPPTRPGLPPAPTPP